MIRSRVAAAWAWRSGECWRRGLTSAVIGYSLTISSRSALSYRHHSGRGPMMMEGWARSAGVSAMSVCSPVAVIGAGNVGCALAADLALRGAEIRLFNRSPGRLATIRDAGGIIVTGEIEGFAPLSLVTGSLEEAVDGAGVVAVTVPTASLPAYAAALAQATSDEQLIWLNPGHSGGALYLAAELARAGRGERTICQLTTASHASRLTSPATVRVFLRARASVAALPASHLEECHRRLDALRPGRERARSRPGQPQRDLAPARDGV